MKSTLGPFLAALATLTRLPMPAWAAAQPAWVQAGVRHYPAVGLLVGAFSAWVLWAAAHGWPATVAVGLAMAASLWLTAGRQDIAWALTCDALAGHASAGRPPALDARAEPDPMRPPALGGPAVLGLLVLLGLKAVALVGLVQHSWPWALLVLPLAQAWAGLLPVLLMAALPQVATRAPPTPPVTRAKRADSAALPVAVAWCLAAALVAWACGAPPERLGLAALALLAVAVGMARLLQQRLGGWNAAALGAAQQAAELAICLAWLVLW